MRPATILITAAALTLSACSVFTPPIEKPIIEDTVGKRIGTLATTAERRTVLVDFESGQYCAEASPDAIQAISSSMRVAASHAAKNADGSERDTSAEFARALATSVAVAGPRTQGVLLFRDASFVMCQERVKGVTTAPEFWKRFDALLTIASDLIKQEIPLLAARTEAAANVIAAQPQALPASGVGAGAGSAK